MNIKNKVLGLFILTLILLFGLQVNITPAFAQNELLFGQNHFYTIIFRGNGEAIVYSKIIVTNSNDTPLTQLSFEIPAVTPSELVIYQQKLSAKCAQYDYRNPAGGPPSCIRYTEPDYNSYYSYSYGIESQNAEYKKINPSQSGNLYKLSLPYTIEPYKASAIIIAYAAKGYVKESFGLYNFSFETLKVPSRINNVKVAIDVDSDLLLKGNKAQVNYGVNSLAIPTPQGFSSISSLSLDKIVGRIGTSGSLVKEAKNLAPNESFTVKGEYATSWFRLYLGSILLTILIVGVLIGGTLFLTKFLGRRNKGNETAPVSATANQQITFASAGKPNPIRVFDITNLLMGLLSVLIVIGLTLLLQFITQSDLLRGFRYNNTIIWVIISITILLMYIMAILGPAIFVASRKGWKALLFVLGTEFVWFVVFIIIYIVLFQSTAPITPRPGPIIY